MALGLFKKQGLDWRNAELVRVTIDFSGLNVFALKAARKYFKKRFKDWAAVGAEVKVNSFGGTAILPFARNDVNSKNAFSKKGLLVLEKVGCKVSFEKVRDCVAEDFEEEVKA